MAWLIERCWYVQGEFEDAAAYQRLDEALAKIEAQRQIPGNRLFYLATPPDAFVPIVKRLGEKGLANEQDRNTVGAASSSKSRSVAILSRRKR